MSRSLADAAPVRHRTLLDDVRPKPAKAFLKTLENAPIAEEIGGAIERAVAMVGWSKKEAAGQMGVEPAQLSRWIAGTERPQMDRIFAVAALREPVVVALAQLAGADISTRIEFPKVSA